MKDKIIYILIFVGAFILTTAVLIFLNSQFNNIFKLDFSSPELTSVTDSLTTSSDKGQNGLADTTNSFAPKITEKRDLVIPEDSRLTDQIANNTKLEDSLSILLKVIDEMKNKEKNPDEQAENTKTEETPENEKAGYEDWLVKTSKLYASMDSKKAAKIIQNYSDNIARDILYSMNKKKAAEILAEFKPELATRIMSLN